MSEYQYYEFAAIDRPLTRAEMTQLRAVSTRAEITPAGFVNHYEWGDLKANPADWMRRYFDAFVYTANWCSCRLALRMPLKTFKKSELKPFPTQHTLSIEASDEHWIIDWSLDESEDHDRFGMEDGSGAIDAQAQRGSASGYQQAVRALAELAEGYALTSSRKEFDHGLRRLLVRHAKRGALIRRLIDAGLWSE
ncbi:MAG TPA: hypothetical protein VE029_05865 [Rhizobacter sp.]|nr:hypothetical protein [Rhizobacter sp.]